MVLSLLNMSEVDGLVPQTDETLLFKFVGLAIHKLAAPPGIGPPREWHCPYVPDALRRGLIWVAACSAQDADGVVEDLQEFLPEFLALQPHGDTSRAAVIFLPQMLNMRRKDQDRISTEIGIGGYFDAGLMPGTMMLPIALGRGFLLPLVIVRHLVPGDAKFIKEGSVDPRRQAGATAAYQRLFGPLT